MAQIAQTPSWLHVDAASAQVTEAPDLPWYLAALLVSQPLHFGDYGRLPMKLLWALLDIATILVLGTGLYLWLKRRQTRSLVEEAGVASSDAGTLPAQQASWRSRQARTSQR